MRRTKIVATLGPATESREMIRALLKVGVDVVRLNQSHGDRAWHEKAFATIREESDRLGRAVAVMVDLQGPKIRTSKVAGGAITLKRGATVDIVPGEDVGDEKTLYTPLPQLVKDVKPGNRVLLDDGKIILRVISKGRDRARAKVLVGGSLSDHKGMNLPGVKLSVPSVTERDLDNLRWAAGRGAEYVAVSFVRSAADITLVRSELHKLGSDLRIVAKIEKPEAVAAIDEIAAVADGLMVARGDLGVEMSLEEVPVAQMRIIAAAHNRDIPVVVATQMLDSMTTKPRPTRAEVSDVAGAIFGNTDAVMLSGETAVGDYPLESVRMMSSIAEHAERHLVESHTLQSVLSANPVYAIADAVCHGAYSAAIDLGAKAVFVATTSGRTALLFSKYRFPGALVGAGDNPASVRRMALYWGVRPILVKKHRDHHGLLDAIVKESLKHKCVASGDTVVYVAGSPLGKSGTANLLMVHRVPPSKATGGRAISAMVPGGVLSVNTTSCVSCGACVGACPAGVFVIRGARVGFRNSRLAECIGDWQCRDCCPVGAISAKAYGKGAK
jgi:pyruvate kinase